jgi:hypothetical protein
MCLMFVSAVGCSGSKPRDLIVGKWKAESAALTMEFMPDGSMASSLLLPDGNIGPKQAGKYRFVGDDTIEMETPVKVDKAKVSVTPETLTMTFDLTNVFQPIGPTAKNDNPQTKTAVVKLQRINK